MSSTPGKTPGGIAASRWLCARALGQALPAQRPASSRGGWAQQAGSGHRDFERDVVLVGLSGWGDRKPHQLSGGMQQRVGLARALAAETDIMLMDEAFSALDPLIRRDMRDQLIDLQRQLGKTVVFITHDLNEAMRLGDRIAMMREGRIVQLGTALEILSHPADDYVARFIADVDRSRVITADAIMEPANGGPGAGDVPPKMILADLVSHAARSPEPLQVVEDGRVLGVIPREALLTALGHESEKVPAAAGTIDEGGVR